MGGDARRATRASDRSPQGRDKRSLARCAARERGPEGMRPNARRHRCGNAWEPDGTEPSRRLSGGRCGRSRPHRCGHGRMARCGAKCGRASQERAHERSHSCGGSCTATSGTPKSFDVRWARCSGRMTVATDTGEVTTIVARIGASSDAAVTCTVHAARHRHLRHRRQPRRNHRRRHDGQVSNIDKDAETSTAAGTVVDEIEREPEPGARGP